MASLLDVASALATVNPTRPSQSFLRRAVSTAYYAVFQAFASECADQFIGGASRTETDWARVYRALDHGPTRNACTQLAGIVASPEIVQFAAIFLVLQEERHRADYDPNSRYTRENVIELIEEAARAIRHLRAAPKSDRRALAVLAMFKKR